MLIVEVLLDEKSGKMMSIPCTQIEKDPSVPHCTILTLAESVVREVPGQPSFQVRIMSIPSIQVRAWYEGQPVEKPEQPPVQVPETKT